MSPSRPETPKTVSIIICNFNYGRYLRECVASALAQTVACQVIVVDDGSTDDSRATLADMPPQVEVVLQENAGQVAAYNAGFMRARGDVVIFLDADDALEPTAVATALPAFGSTVAKVHFRLALVDEQGRPTGGSIPGNLARGDLLPALRDHGLLFPSAPGSGNAYRRSALAPLFPLPVSRTDKVGADFFTIYGSVAFGTVQACDEALGRYRLHQQPQAAEQLVFGNAALGNDEAAKVETRWAALRQLVAARTGGKVAYPDEFLDFSVLKSSYAGGVLGRPYFEALFGSGRPLSRLLRALWLQPAYSLKKRLGLTAWCLLVLLAPRRTATRLARYVCNPASRGT